MVMELMFMDLLLFQLVTNFKLFILMVLGSAPISGHPQKSTVLSLCTGVYSLTTKRSAVTTMKILGVTQSVA